MLPTIAVRNIYTIEFDYHLHVAC